MNDEYNDYDESSSESVIADDNQDEDYEFNDDEELEHNHRSRNGKQTNKGKENFSFQL